MKGSSNHGAKSGSGVRHKAAAKARLREGSQHDQAYPEPNQTADVCATKERALLLLEACRARQGFTHTDEVQPSPV